MRYFTSIFLVLLITANAVAIEIDEKSPKTIKSDRIEYNLKTSTIKTYGNTEITNDAGQKIKTDGLSLSKNTNIASIDNPEIWLGHNVYIRAKSIEKHGNNTVAHKAMFTACNNCDSFGNTWEIFGNTIIHDSNEKMLYFHNAFFELYNGEIPIFWLPYYAMPDPSVKYKSGLLTPSFNTTNGMGLQINVPLYVNLSDKHDLTTTLSYLTNENPLFQLEHRLNLSRSEMRTKGSFTRNQDGKNRWHVYNNDIIELGENARAFVYIQRTSDKTYLQKYGFYDYQPYLDSGAKLEIFGQNGYIFADTHIFQELREPTGNQVIAGGNILPNIHGTYKTQPLFAETYLLFNGDVLGVSTKNSDSQRLIGDARIISPWTLWGGNRLTTSLSARYDIYNFHNTNILENENVVESYSGIKTRFLPSGYIEWGLPLFSSVNNWTYTLEPRARLTITDHTYTDSVFAYNNDSSGRFLSNMTLFSNNRYSGYDVWENGNFIDYGGYWSAFNDDNTFSIFLGQTYDFKNKNKEDINDFNENGFRNGFSDYVAAFSYNNNNDSQFATRFRLDNKNMSLRHMENTVYFGKDNNYISLGHIWDAHPVDILSTQDKDTHETMAGAGIQITKRVNIKGGITYNMYDHFIQRHSGGIFYNHPCYYLSLEYHRDNAIKDDYVGGTTIQFKFGISIDGKHY